MRIHPISLAHRYLKGQRTIRGAPYFGKHLFASEEEAATYLRKNTGRDFGTDGKAWGVWLNRNRWVYYATKNDPRLILPKCSRSQDGGTVEQKFKNITDRATMDIQEIEVPRPLLDCFLCCEIHCVRECCGINAFSTDIGTIAEWGRDAGSKVATEALSQLKRIIETVKDRERFVSSLDLNHVTCDEQARQELLDFLASFQQGLQMAVNVGTRDAK